MNSPTSYSLVLLVCSVETGKTGIRVYQTYPLNSLDDELPKHVFAAREEIMMPENLHKGVYKISYSCNMHYLDMVRFYVLTYAEVAQLSRQGIRIIQTTEPTGHDGTIRRDALLHGRINAPKGLEANQIKQVTIRPSKMLFRVTELI